MILKCLTYLLLIVSFASCKKVHTPSFNHKADGWLTDLKLAQEIAKKEKRNVLVDFWADWCQACKIMEKKLFSSNEFKNLAKKNNLLLVRLDLTDSNEEKDNITDKFNVKGLPTVLILRPNGSLIESLVGFTDKSLSMQYLRIALKRG